ncbi:MAG: hypothetical protein HC802_01895 [Caldilineaceae bacterium]|nr:hypothetical protein [Caldilineaceae bacterium]
MRNSLMLATLTTAIGVVLTAMAAYSFSRFRFRARRSLLQTILLIQVFPNFLNMVALFVILQQLGVFIPWLGLNTHGGLLLIYLGGVMGVNTWLAKGYFDAIPRDLETVVLKAIARDPALRYQTATEFAADLRRFTEDRPIQVDLSQRNPRAISGDTVETDDLVSIENINGTIYDDTLIGSGGGNVLDGFAGDDVDPSGGAGQRLC